jgi:hypothetical protein
VSLIYDAELADHTPAVHLAPIEAVHNARRPYPTAVPLFYAQPIRRMAPNPRKAFISAIANDRVREFLFALDPFVFRRLTQSATWRSTCGGPQALPFVHVVQGRPDPLKCVAVKLRWPGNHQLFVAFGEPGPTLSFAAGFFGLEADESRADEQKGYAPVGTPSPL